MLKLLHTSDVQLDAPFGFLGARGEDHRKLLREAFVRIISLADKGDFDLVLIAGDLFDSNSPHQATVEFVATQIARLDIPVCILPGNHDCYDERSIYRKWTFPHNARVLTERPTTLVLSNLGLTVYGNPIRSKQSRVSPLEGLKPTGQTQWHVALAHGNVVRPDILDPPRPIRPEEIAVSCMDYVALGDWHSFADYSQGEVTAYYSGAPELTGLGQTGAGYVACVELHDGGVSVRKERVGAVSTDELKINVTGRTGADVAQLIREHADPSLMVQVILTGLTELGTILSPGDIEQELASDFYHITCTDRSHPQVEAVSSEDYPEELVIGKFARLMLEQIDRAESEREQRRAELALQLGIALLERKEVL